MMKRNKSKSKDRSSRRRSSSNWASNKIRQQSSRQKWRTKNLRENSIKIERWKSKLQSCPKQVPMEVERISSWLIWRTKSKNLYPSIWKSQPMAGRLKVSNKWMLANKIVSQPIPLLSSSLLLKSQFKKMSKVTRWSISNWTIQKIEGNDHLIDLKTNKFLII